MGESVAVFTRVTPIRDEDTVRYTARLEQADLRPVASRRLGTNAVEVALGSDYAIAPPEFADVDCNIVSATDRKKRILIADMDSTMIPVECIDELADFAGVKPQVSDITERAMRGELDFEAALRERVGLLKDLPVAVLEECYQTRIQLNPGARVLVQTMAAQGAATALVSGGFTFFTSRVTEAAGFDENRANTLDIADGKLTGLVIDPILGREAKLVALTEIATRINAQLTSALAVGDGANDLDMVEASGLGVAYHAKPALAERADARINHSDLTALLSLQGIETADFVV